MHAALRVWTYGWGMYALGLVLLASLSVAVERALWFRRSAFDAEELLDFVEERVLARDVEAAVTQCTLFTAPVVRVILAGLLRLDRGAPETASALEQAVLREGPRAERGMAWLATLAQVAALLGLFGAITALIYGSVPSEWCVAATGPGPTIDPARRAEMLACDIGQALRCVQLGLLVAIVTTVGYALLRYAVRARERELRAAAARVVALADTHRALQEPGVPYR